MSLESSRSARILFLGATGYIGGSVLGRLLQHPARASWEIICYSRNQEKAKILENTFHINTIIGSLSESQKLEDAAASADIVIHTAESADHIASVQAILKGLKRKHEESLKVPIYIHTSGTGELIDNARGMHNKHTSYDDTNIPQLKSIPDDAIHRNVDLAVLAADAQGFACTYMIFPSVIYGLASGPMFDAKLANAHSMVVPLMVKTSIDRGSSGIIGEGRNVWPHVHVHDVAELYMVLLDQILQDPERPGHGWEGFYFAENGMFTFLELAQAIGNVLAKSGHVGSADPTPYMQEEVQKYFGGSEFLGSNSICVSNRARAIGWNPQYTTEDFLSSVQPEIKAILASGQLGLGNKFTDTLAMQQPEP